MIATALLIAAALTASAQTPGSLEGTIRDGTGSAIPSARVEAHGMGAPRSTIADANGRCRIDGLAQGRYTVRAGQSGFAPSATTADVSGDTVTADLTLGIVAAAESVTVTGDATDPKALDVTTDAGSRAGPTARETPATVDVITFADAQARGLRSSIEALTSVPAVSSANLPNSQGITAIRGFTGGAISMLYDGTRVTTSTIVSRNYDSWSFDRIEVLKGPASVLFGEGALAGAVNLVPKRPEFTTRRSEALVSYGSLDTARLAAGTTGPIGSGRRAAYRADIVWNNTAGYVDDAGSDSLAINGAIDVRLGSAATMSVAVDHVRDTIDNAYCGTPLVPRASARPTA